MSVIPPPRRPRFWLRQFYAHLELEKAVAVRNSLLAASFPANFDAAGNFFTDFPPRQHQMLSLPSFGHFPAREMAAGKSARSSATLLDFLLRDRHSLLEFS